MRIALLGNKQAPWCTELAWAGSFEQLGHEVSFLQEGETRAVDVARLVKGHDLFFHVQTYGLAVTGGTIEERFAMVAEIKDMGIPTVAGHLDRWIGLQREHQVAEEPYFQAMDYVFTADGGHQAEFAAYGVNHIWSPPAVFAPECVLGTPQRRYASRIAFIGNWRTNSYHAEATHRHALIEFLRRNYRGRVKFFPTHGQIRGRELSDLYASVDVVVGDSCVLPGEHSYSSDRPFESVGRGAFLLHPLTGGIIPGLLEPGEHMDAWEMGDWDALRALIARYLNDPGERDRIRIAGFEHVRTVHTYTQRAAAILEVVFGQANRRATPNTDEAEAR